MRALLAVLLLCVPVLGHAQTPAPQISVLTFAPGEIYWQRFGHNALLVRQAGQALVYNYGIFDFRQEHFFLNFARARMRYRLDVTPLYPTLQYYAAENRWAVEQHLALSPHQARALADFLAWNARPENAEYRYDYFTANCSTRVRDALDQVLGGALRRTLQARPGHGSYRSEVLRLMAPQPVLMLGMDLGLGPRVDEPLDQWQEGFIPMRLMAALRGVRIAADDGTQRPLVASERWLIVREDRTGAPVPYPTALFLSVGLALGASMWGLNRMRAHTAARIALGMLAGGAVLAWALAGSVLLLGWLATEHWGMAANRNLLLLNPLWWVLLPCAAGQWRRAPSRPRRVARLAMGAFATLSVLSLPWALVGVQPNLHWVALLLPPQLAVLHLLRSADDVRGAVASG